MVEAIVADIHGNLEALEAVLADIDKNGIDKIVCLGDVIGYGPNPKECIDLVQGFKISVLGNHDEAALFPNEAAFFNEKARDAINWTRKLLEDKRDAVKNGRRWDYLGELPRFSNNGAFLVHGSPRDPVREYIFPEILNMPDKLDMMFERFEKICFVAHTHLPGVIYKNGIYQYLIPLELPISRFRLGEREKAIVNVGSVGQPRDGDNRSCYIVYDGQTVEFRRVKYNYFKTMEKIYKIIKEQKAGNSDIILDPDLANRLVEGR